MIESVEEHRRGLNRLQATGKPRTDVDIEAAKALRPFSGGDGRVAVEMDYIPDGDVIKLPETVANWSMPDRGTVVAVGETVIDLRPGDVVFVMPYDGMQMYDEAFGAYVPKSQIRFYGHEGVKYSDMVLTKVDGERLVPLGSNVIIKLDPMKEESHGLILPDISKRRSPTATVVALGPEIDTDEIEVGMRVMFSPNHVMEFSYNKELSEMGVIHFDHLWGEVPS